MRKEREGIIWALLTAEERSEIPTPKSRQAFVGDSWVEDDQSDVLVSRAYRPRPKPLPKLTLEWIEENGGWPTGMHFAAVDKDGSAFFYYRCPKIRGKDAELGKDAEWDNGGQCVFIKYVFDSSDYKNSLIRRPEPAKKYRPWTPEEAVGKVVRYKDQQSYHVITEVVDGSACVGSIVLNLEDLGPYTQLDGTPCGVEVKE